MPVLSFCSTQYMVVFLHHFVPSLWLLANRGVLCIANCGKIKEMGVQCKNQTSAPSLPKGQTFPLVMTPWGLALSTLLRTALTIFVGHFCKGIETRLTPGALMFMAPQVQPNLNLSMILPQYAVLCTAPEIDIL